MENILTFVQKGADKPRFEISVSKRYGTAYYIRANFAHSGPLLDLSKFNHAEITADTPNVPMYLHHYTSVAAAPAILQSGVATGDPTRDGQTR